MLTTIFLLLCGHYVADIVLQSEKTGIAKNRHSTSPGYRPEIHGPKRAVWIHELTGHAMSHGLAVYLATGKIELGIAETILHWTIDYNKGEGRFNVHVDQGLHILCKFLYLGYLYA